MTSTRALCLVALVGTACMGTSVPALSQTISTTAGSGLAGYSGDGGPAIDASFNGPSGLAFDAAGNLYIADQYNSCIRMVDTSGTVTTVAGTGIAGDSGDGGPATAAQMNRPKGIALDEAGNIYIADWYNHRIRKIDPSGVITTVAGTGTAGYSGDGGPATEALLCYPAGVDIDGQGNLYIADQSNFRIRKVDEAGVITTVAGTSTAGFMGDGGPATAARLQNPLDVVVDAAGAFYIADYNNQRVRKVDAAGTITTVAGTGAAGYSGDGGPATEADLSRPWGVGLDGQGNLYIAEPENHVIRRVHLQSGIISTAAGNGIAGNSGDGGLATEARLYSPADMAWDSEHNLYIPDADQGHRVRRVTALAPPPPVATVSAVDTTATYARQIEIPVQVENVAGLDIVSAEVFMAYDGDLLTATGADIAGTLLTTDWSVETNLVEGSGTSIDTIKIAMATDDDVLAGAGTLIYVSFQVADIRHPASSPLTLAHVLLNDGTPENTVIDGSVSLVGVDGTILSISEEILPRWTVTVTVDDTDEDRDAEGIDRFDVAVICGGQTEALTLEETDVSTGLFTGTIQTVFSLSFTSDDGIVQTKAGDQIVFASTDSLSATGTVVERRDTTVVLGGTDGEIQATVVSQPGDTVRVRIKDADLSEWVAVEVANPRTGESESILLSQVDGGSDVFYGRFFTVVAPGAGDSALAVMKGDVLSISYADTLRANGGTALVVDDDEVVDPFGDAHPNGNVQAYDAAQVLRHRLSTYGGGAGTLSGLDSLCANVDQAAPSGIIDAYDAALILKKIVGLIDRFEVQEPDAANHPQPETQALPKRMPAERLLSLRRAEDYVFIWVEDRRGIVSGEVTLEGISGQVVMSEELPEFLSVSRQTDEGVQILFAGPRGVDGAGELLRVYGAATEQARLAGVRLNGGRLVARAQEKVTRLQLRRSALLGNAPNPFNPETTIRFELGASGPVKLTVYDLTGRRVRTLLSRAQLPAGPHRVVWDGRDNGGRSVSSGVYFYQLTAGEGFAQMRSMLLLK